MYKFCYGNYTTPKSREEFNDYDYIYYQQISENGKQGFFDFSFLKSIKYFVYICLSYSLKKFIYYKKYFFFFFCFMVYFWKNNFYIELFKNDNLAKSSIFFCLTMISIIIPNNRSIWFLWNNAQVLSNFFMISTDLQI